MAQDPQAPAKVPVPGEDVLLETIRNSRITDTQRQQLWDVYHTPGDEKAFVKGLNTLDFQDDIKQTLYDIRYNGFQNLPTKQQALTPRSPETEKLESSLFKGPTAPSRGQTTPPLMSPNYQGVKGLFGETELSIGSQQDIRQGEKAIQDSRFKDPNRPFSIGDIRPTEAPVVPDWMIPGLAAGQKIAVEPFEKAAAAMYQGGQEAGGDIYKALLHPGDTLSHPLQTLASKQLTEETVKESPIGMGVSRGAGALVGGVAGDIRNLPFFGAAAARPLLRRLISAGFGTQMAGGTYDQAKNLYQNWDSLSSQERSQGLTELLGGSAFTGLALHGMVTDLSTPTSTHMGPVDTSKGLNPGTEAVVKAPAEAHAPQATGFVGKDNIIRPWDPRGTRFAKGGTIGMDPITINRSPVDIKAAIAIEGPKGGEDTYRQRITNAGLVAGQKGYGDNGMLFDMEHPDFHNLSAAWDFEKDGPNPTAQQLRSKMADRLETFAENPPRVPGQPEFKSEDIRAAVDKLREPERVWQMPTQGQMNSLDPMQAALAREAAARAKVSEIPKPEPPKSANLPSKVHDAINLAVDLSKQKDIASEDSVDKVEDNRAKAEAIAKGAAQNHIEAATGQQLVQIRDEAQELHAQAKNSADSGRALTDAHVKNRGTEAAVTESLATGGPVRYMVDPVTGERVLAKERAEIGNREVRGKLAEARGLVPRWKYSGEWTVTGTPKGVSPQEWGKAVDFLHSEHEDILGQLHGMLEMAKDTGDYDREKAAQLAERKQDIDREIEGTVQKTAVLTTLHDAGRLKEEPLKHNADGSFEAPGTIKSWNLARAKEWMGYLRQIPTDEEFYRHADGLDEKARMYGDIRDGAIKELDRRKAERLQKRDPSQTGIAGTILGKVKPVSLTDVVPRPEDLIKNAKKAGLSTFKVDADHPAPNRAWLITTADGKLHAIDLGFGLNDETLLTHDGSAKQMLGNPNFGHGVAEEILRKSGLAVQRTEARSFHIGTSELSSSQGNAIQMALIIDRLTDRDFFLDMKSPMGGIRTLRIQPGWEDIHEAVTAEKRRDALFTSQSGKISGTGMLASGATGAAIGGAIGGLPGAGVGLAVGFVTHAALGSRPVRVAMKTMAPIIRGAGVSMSSFFRGIPQVSLDGIDPTGARILADQKMHADRSTSWMDRAKLFPANIAKELDPLAFIADKAHQTVLGQHLMNLFDQSGEMFRDLHLPDTQSLYTAVHDAQTRANGLRSDMGIQYQALKMDAYKEGLRDVLKHYLNLKGYTRTLDVLHEHIQDLKQTANNIEGKLQDPKLTVREIGELQDKLKDIGKMQKDIRDKIASGEANPGGYTRDKIAQSEQATREQLGPEKFARVEEFAQRAFKIREKILDMIHSNGLIGDEDYLKYKQRGIEYVPMDRIVDDLAQNRFHSSAQPLDLKHQTVIKTLEGSKRTNVDPFEAFSRADARAFNQIIRNDTMRHLVDLAGAYPNTVGGEVHPVDTAYRAKAGEMLLGHYQGGKPNMYAVPEYLGEVMQRFPGAAKTTFGAFGKWLTVQYKHGVTVAQPAFLIAGAWAHALASKVYSPSARDVDLKTFAKSWGRAAVSAFKEDEAYRETVRNGAAMSTWQAYLTPDIYANPSELGWARELGRGNVIKGMAELAQHIAMIDKVNIYTLARKAGHNERAAGIEARKYGGIPDFSGMGDIRNYANLIFMFSNARLKYLSQATQAIREDPKAFIKIGLAMTAMNLANLAWNTQQKDSKGNDLYRKISQFDKDRYWVTILPPSVFGTDNRTGAEMPYYTKVPKFYGGQLLNPIDHIAAKIFGKDDREGTQIALDSLSSVSPIQLHLRQHHLMQSGAQSAIAAVNPILKTPFQQITNTNDYGGPIVPGSQQGIDPRLQIGPNTSELAKTMGQGGLKGAGVGALAGAAIGTTYGGPLGGGIGAALGGGLGAAKVPPRRLEAGIKSTFGAMGDLTESYLSPFLGGVQRSRGALDSLYGAPVVGPIARRFIGPGRGIDQQEQTLSQQFYDNVQKASEPSKTIEYVKKHNPQQFEEFKAQNKEMFDNIEKTQVYVHRIQTIDEHLNKLRQAVADPNPQITTEAREASAEALKNLYAAKISILQIFNQNLKEMGKRGQNEAAPNPGVLRP